MVIFKKSLRISAIHLTLQKTTEFDSGDGGWDTQKLEIRNWK